MTRETKLGFGIAGTFLTIAGSWVGVKLYRGEAAATEDPPAAVAAEEAEPKLESPVAATAPAPAAEATPQPVAAATPAPAADAPSPAAIKPDADAVVQSAPASPPPPMIPAAVIATPATSEPSPPVVPTPMGDPSPPAIVAPVIPAPAPEQPAPATAPTATPEKPAPVVEPPPVAAPILSPAVETKKDPEPPPVVETKKDPEPPPGTIVITKPADPPTPTPPAPPGEPSVVLVPASPGGAASLGPPGGAANPPREPFSTANNPRSPAEPRAQSYLEEEYRWQPGDGFAMLSQKFYFSDKYSAALQQYNRDYPLAGPSLKQNPPSIVPGHVIWVPPVRILERDYPTWIAGVQPLTERGMPATNAVRPVESNVAANAPQLYRVRERGETMYEIARRTLNDSGQWNAVHRLNPTLSRDPRFPIPAGTVLRLPGEAKLEAADKP